MRSWITTLCLLLALVPQGATGDVIAELAGSGAQVHVLGEIHDNPAHHARQAAYLHALKPRAVVFEMLLPAEAARLDGVARDPGALRDAMQGLHWSNIADYAQVLAAGSGAIVGAALPRAQVRRAYQDGAARVFGGQAERYGLSAPLPPEQMELRMALQFAAHCEAMPMAMMGGMVEAQRLRDAHFARVVLDALDQHGAPVALVTGNGHARRDWGVPAVLNQARPDLEVIALGQAEGGAELAGVYDAVISAPVPDRPDPCAVFR